MSFQCFEFHVFIEEEARNKCRGVERPWLRELNHDVEERAWKLSS